VISVALLKLSVHVNVYSFFVSFRVKKVVGFEASDMIGHKIMNFFHPRDCNDKGHQICRKKCMGIFLANVQ